MKLSNSPTYIVLMGVSSAIHTDEFQVIRKWKYSQLLLKSVKLPGAQWDLVFYRPQPENCWCASVFYYQRSGLLLDVERKSLHFAKIFLYSCIFNAQHNLHCLLLMHDQYTERLQNCKYTSLNTDKCIILELKGIDRMLSEIMNDLL